MTLLPRITRLSQSEQPAALQSSVTFLVSLLESGPPAEFRIFPAGHYETTKGIFKFTATSGREVMERFKAYGNELPLDYGHAMHMPISLDPAESGKAAGWFTPELRGAELWATNVRYTHRAEKMLRDREYRYFSPTFLHSEDGEIQELWSIALTNQPATTRMKPLMAAKPEAPKAEPNIMLKLLAQKLGLADTATETEVLAALDARLLPVAQLSHLTGKGPAESLGLIAAWKAGAEECARLTKQMAELEAKHASDEKDRLIVEGVKGGKVPPAMKEFLSTLSVEQVKVFLASAPSVAPAPAPKPGETKFEASKEEESIARMMGVPLDAYLKSKERHGGQVTRSAMNVKSAPSDE